MTLYIPHSDDLATKVERGEATDAEVAQSFGYKYNTRRDTAKLTGKQYLVGWWTDPTGSSCSNPPPFTTSLDACARECERQGWKWAKGGILDGLAMLVRGRRSIRWHHSMTDETPEGDSRALCAAMLRALDAEKGENE